LRPSASITSGTSTRSNISSAKSRAPGFFDNPGPSTTASDRPIAFTAGPPASRLSAPSVSGSPTIIASRRRTVNESSRLAGAPTVT
jgi:hypothetical protein